MRNSNVGSGREMIQDGGLSYQPKRCADFISWCCSCDKRLYCHFVSHWASVNDGRNDVALCVRAQATLHYVVRRQHNVLFARSDRFVSRCWIINLARLIKLCPNASTPQSGGWDGACNELSADTVFRRDCLP